MSRRGGPAARRARLRLTRLAAGAMGLEERLRRVTGRPPVGRRRRFAADLRLLRDVVATTPLEGRWWVWSGLLLGWAREGRPLGHDLHDADFAYLAEDRAAFHAAARELLAHGFAPLHRFRADDGTVTQHSFARAGGKFEFFELRREGDALRYHTYADEPGGALQTVGRLPDGPRERFRLLGRTWSKVADHERELAVLYGDWRTPQPGWRHLDTGGVEAWRPWGRPEYGWSGDLDPGRG